MISEGAIEQPDGTDTIWGGLVDAGVVKRMGIDDAHQLMTDALRSHEKPANVDGNLEEHVHEDKPDMSIVKRNQVPAPAFPLDVLGPAADWVRASAETKSAPFDYVALTLLTAAAGIIGSKVQVSPWDGWTEPSIIWGANVGPPSSNKSPSGDDIRDGVRSIERDLNKDWAERQAKYEEEKKIADARRAAWEDEITKNIKGGKKLPSMPDIDLPELPTKKRLWIIELDDGEGRAPTRRKPRRSGLL